MTWAFLVDANLPPALARSIAADGWRAIHASEVGLEATGDADLWQRAAEHDYVIIKDRDFADLAVLRPSRQAVVWVRIGNTRNQAVVERFRSAMPEIIAALDAGEHLIELR